MDEPEHTIAPPAAAPPAAASLAAAPAAVVSLELADLVQQVRDRGVSRVVEDHQSVAGSLWSTPQRRAPMPYAAASPRTGYRPSAPLAGRAAAFDNPAATIAPSAPPVLAPLPTLQPAPAAAAPAATASAATNEPLEATEVEEPASAPPAAVEAPPPAAPQPEEAVAAQHTAAQAKAATERLLSVHQKSEKRQAAAAAVTLTAVAAPMVMDLNSAECESDDDYVASRHVCPPRAPERNPNKRPRSDDTTPAVAALPAVAGSCLDCPIDLCGDSE